MGIGSFLNKRAHVWRKVETGTDPYGNPIETDQIVGVDIPCRVWYRRGARTENETTTINEYEIKAAFFNRADIAEADRLEVYDKCGNKEVDGVQIDVIMNRDKYLDCVLKRYA